VWPSSSAFVVEWRDKPAFKGPRKTKSEETFYSIHICYSSSIHICYSSSIHICYSSSIHICYSSSIHICYSSSIHICYSRASTADGVCLLSLCHALKM
jgi:hypothetical protein